MSKKPPEWPCNATALLLRMRAAGTGLLVLPLDAGLLHQIGNTLFKVIYPGAHIVDAGNDLVRHRLELVLHILQQVLHLVWRKQVSLSATVLQMHILPPYHYLRISSVPACSSGLRCCSASSSARHRCRFQTLHRPLRRSVRSSLKHTGKKQFRQTTAHCRLRLLSEMSGYNATICGTHARTQQHPARTLQSNKQTNSKRKKNAENCIFCLLFAELSNLPLTVAGTLRSSAFLKRWHKVVAIKIMFFFVTALRGKNKIFSLALRLFYFLINAIKD